jgi:hypothetical protein
MSESVTALPISAPLSETTRAEIEFTQPKLVESADLAVNRIPLRSEEEVQIKARVDQKLKALEKVDIYADDEDGIVTAFADIFSEADAKRKQSMELSNYFTQRNFRGAQDSESFKAVTGLAEALHKFDPSKFDLSQPEGLLKWLPIPGMAKKGLANYARSFKEAQGQIDELMDGVAQVAEDGVKSKIELKSFDKKLLKLSKELRIEYETLTEVSKGIDAYLGELKERDPMKADKIETELRYRLAQARQDTQTTLLQTINGSILISSLVRTQDMIITGAKRASTSGRLILTINQTIAGSISEQKDAQMLLERVDSIIGDMTEGNAKMTLEHVQRMKELAASPLGQAAKLEKAFALGIQAINELQTAQKTITANIENNIVKADEILKKATGQLSADNVAIETFGAAVESSQALAASRANLSKEATASRPKTGM